MKKRYLIVFISALLLAFTHSTSGQNNRINTSNNIGWYNYFGTFKLSSKFGIHSEYQWRRNNIITNWQQSLLRVGINYNRNSNVLFREFTEHRIFEMAQISHKEGIIDLSHRFMLEQRFVGKYSSASVSTEDEFPLLNRARYMFKLQAPLTKKNNFYIAVYDELFIGFGKNVNANVFDQNRIGILFGHKFNKNIKIEVGCLNQTLQFGRLIDGKNVFQNNNGLIINAHFNFDCSKKSQD
jgi:hypothetical protein